MTSNLDYLADGVVLELTCNGSPVQYEGTVDGHPAYFRARWSSWRFTIARMGDSAVSPSHPEGPLYSGGGQYDEDGCGMCAGLMPNEDAERLIVVGVGVFRATRGERE